MRKNPEKTSPRKLVLTRDRTQACCVTGTHTTACPTAVDFSIDIVAGMLKFHWNIIWRFHYRDNVYFMCSSSERSVNYATKVAGMLLSSACEEQWNVARFLWAKGHNLSEIHRAMWGMFGETVWTIAMSPGGVHSTRNCHLEELILLEDVTMVHTCHIQYVPVNFS